MDNTSFIELTRQETICAAMIFGVFPLNNSLEIPIRIPHKKVSRDLTEKKQDLTEMSIILMVLTEI